MMGWIRLRAELSTGPFYVTRPNPTHGSTQPMDNSAYEWLTLGARPGRVAEQTVAEPVARQHRELVDCFRSQLVQRQ